MTCDTLHLERWHFMLEYLNSFSFFLSCLPTVAINIDWAAVGWIESFNTFQKTYILQCKKLEFLMFFSLSFLLILAVILPFARYSKSPRKTSAPYLSARVFGSSMVYTCCFYRQCYTRTFKWMWERWLCGALGFRGGLSRLSTFEVLHTFIANLIEALAYFIIFFFQKLDVLLKTGW